MYRSRWLFLVHGVTRGRPRIGWAIRRRCAKDIDLRVPPKWCAPDARDVPRLEEGSIPRAMPSELCQHRYNGLSLHDVAGSRYTRAIALLGQQQPGDAKHRRHSLTDDRRLLRSNTAKRHCASDVAPLGTPPAI